MMRRRQFAEAITLLENHQETFEASFDFYLLLGTACLYVGDIGNANKYYSKARTLKVNDVTLLTGQAALFLLHGDTDRAIQYYLDIQTENPTNKIAGEALEFIKTKGNYDTIIKWADSGKLEQFYPPLGVNPARIFQILFSVAAGVVLAFVLLHFANGGSFDKKGRYDFTGLELTIEENMNAHSGGKGAHYNLSDTEIKTAYNKAVQFIQDYRDNAAHVEINRILNSNASDSIKQKTKNELLPTLQDPTFDSLTDNYSYAQVSADPLLYQGCWVSWKGRITNASESQDSFICDLLVGYENLDRVDGIVRVNFAKKPSPPIDSDRAVTILAKIGMEGKRLALTGRAVYQEVRKN